MCSLHVNGTNAHNIGVQNNIGIYKRVTLNRNKSSGHHQLYVVLTDKTMKLIFSFKIKTNYTAWKFLKYINEVAPALV